MAYLPETATWGPGIYQLEETDPVQGGPNGVDNAQGKEIANRLLYLKNLVTSLGNDKLAITAKSSSAQATTGTDDTTWMTPLRVAEAIAALASIALATDTTAGKVELATVAETVTGTDTQRATHAAGVKGAIDAAIAALVNSSPATLNTLSEIATALGNDPNFATSVTNMIAGKQPLDATLTALSGLTTAANQIAYSTGADAFAMTSLTAYARTLLASADAAAAITALGAATLDVPQNAQGSDYQLALSDRGKSIDLTAASLQAIVPANGTVAFPVGATITITNTTNSTASIAPAANVTLRLAGTANTGQRTLAPYGVATMRKVATDTWIVSGAGLS